MGDPRDFQFELLAEMRPEVASLTEYWYPGIRDAAERTSSHRIFDPILGIRAIVLHATCGSSSAGAASVIFDHRASFHWLVPAPGEAQHGAFVWATCYEARAAWHVRNVAAHPAVWGGRRKINHYSLGIEVVSGRGGFSAWQVEATARIVRYAWAKYPNLRHVVSHARLDPHRRTDPGAGFPWAAFEAAVRNGATESLPPLARTAPPMAGSPALSCCMDKSGASVHAV